MKKTLLAVVLLACASIRFPQPVSATTLNETIIAIPPSASFFGQTQRYSVLYRASGKAVVTAQMILTNTSDQPVTAVSYTFSGTMENVRALELTLKPVCIRYEQVTEEIALPDIPKPKTPSRTVTRSQCAEYGEPQADYWQWQNPSSYETIRPVVSGTTLTMDLTRPIPPKKTGSILLSYTVSTEARRTWSGSRAFSFETLKTDDTVQTVTVGISADEGLYLKNARGAVNEQTKSMSAVSDSASGMAAPEMARINQYLPSLGHGQITKSAQQLSPGESLAIKGTYADRVWKLYAKEGLVGFLILAGGITLLVLAVRWSIRHLSLPVAKGSAKAGTTALPLVVLTGFGNALVITSSVVCLVMLQPVLSRYISYQVSGIITILMLLVSIGVWACALFIPAFVIGMKRGIVWGVGTFASTVAWLMIDAVGVILLVVLFFGRSSLIPLPYMMDSAISPLMGQGSSSVEPYKGMSVPDSEPVDLPAIQPEIHPAEDVDGTSRD